MTDESGFEDDGFSDQEEEFATSISEDEKINNDEIDEDQETELRHDWETPEGQKYHAKEYNDSWDKHVELEAKDGPMSKVRAEDAAAKNKLDLEDVYQQIDEAHQKFENEEERIRQQFESGKIDEPTLDHLHARNSKQKVKFQRRIQLKSAGLKNDWGDFSQTMEDIEWMLNDAHDDGEFQKTRHKIRENIRGLSKDERIELIDNLYESGRISLYAYKDLQGSYTW